MEKLVKIKFLPFILGIVTLIIGLLLKYIFQTYTNNSIIRFGGILTFIGFIFLQAIREKIKERKEKEENPEPEKTPEEIEQKKIKSELWNIRNRGLTASAIRHIMSLIMVLFGISEIINKNYKIALPTLAFGIIANIISFNITVKYIKRLKELKPKETERPRFLKYSVKKTVCIAIITFFGTIGLIIFLLYISTRR
jgi:FtsH-binding integral membrane protein